MITTNTTETFYTVLHGAFVCEPETYSILVFRPRSKKPDINSCVNKRETTDFTLFGVKLFTVYESDRYEFSLKVGDNILNFELSWFSKAQFSYDLAYTILLNTKYNFVEIRYSSITYKYQRVPHIRLHHTSALVGVKQILPI